MNLCFYLVGCLFFLLSALLLSLQCYLACGLRFDKRNLFSFLVYESREWKEVYSTLYLCMLFVTEWIL